MAGALGFEPRMAVPKTAALPLGYAPSELLQINKMLQFCKRKDDGSLHLEINNFLRNDWVKSSIPLSNHFAGFL